MSKSFVSIIALPIAFLFAGVVTVHADSYDGPFCFEKSSERFDTPDTKHIRETCKRIEFERIVSLDDSMNNYHLMTQPNDYLSWFEKTGEVTATTSRSFEYSRAGQVFITKNMPQYYSQGPLIDVAYLASDEPYSSYDADDAVNKNKAIFTDVYGDPTYFPYSYYYKGNGGTYVPIMSPLKKVVEYWHVTKKANGFALVKDKTEQYLDDGTMKTEANTTTSASANIPSVATEKGAENLSWWGKFVRFWANLF